MARRLHARKAILAAAAFAILACASLTTATLFWTIHLRVSPGLLLSLKEGCARVACWSPRQMNYDYPRGLSAGRADARWRLRWLPYIHRQPLSTWVGLPLWIPAAIASTIAYRARPRSRPGHCPRCGYDLSGLAAGSACPECGRGSTDTLGP